MLFVRKENAVTRYVPTKDRCGQARACCPTLATLTAQFGHLPDVSGRLEKRVGVYETALPWVRRRADEIRTGANKFGELCAITWGGRTAQSVGLTDRQQAALATVISDWFRYHCRQPYAMAQLDTEFYEDWLKLRHYPERRAQAADKWRDWAEQMLHAADKELSNGYV